MKFQDKLESSESSDASPPPKVRKTNKKIHHNRRAQVPPSVPDASLKEVIDAEQHKDRIDMVL